jgi:cold-inducible RNA-binding protein
MSKKLYIGNLPYSANDESLRTLFEGVGAVATATVIMDRETGRSRGFGFVEMDNDDEAAKAISQLNGTTMDNRQIQVSEARPRPEGGRGDNRPRRDDGDGYRGNRNNNNRDRY